MRTPFVDAQGKKLKAKTVVEAAKEIAKNNHRHPTLTTMLRKWWTDKYRLPWTPNNLGDLTTLDLLTEFYEDLFEKDKTALFEASRGEDGEIMFESTGDTLIDKWEQELAMGLEPDLTEGIGADTLEAMKQGKLMKKAAKSKLQQVASIDDRFDTGSSGINPLDLLGKGN